MLKINGDLSSFAVAAGEPLIVHMTVERNHDLGRSNDDRSYVLAFYKTGRALVQPIAGELLGYTSAGHELISFIRDGSFTEMLYGQSLKVELLERYRNGRNVMATGTLRIDESASGISSFDSAPIGEASIKITATERAEELGSYDFTNTTVPFEEAGYDPSDPLPTVRQPSAIYTPKPPAEGDPLLGIDAQFGNGKTTGRIWRKNGEPLGVTNLITDTEAADYEFETIGLGFNGEVISSKTAISVIALLFEFLWGDSNRIAGSVEGFEEALREVEIRMEALGL